MTSFSQRYGYEPIQMPFQRESLDAALRTKLWNVLAVTIWDHWEPVCEFRSRGAMSTKIEDLVKGLWLHFFNLDLDRLPEFKERYDRKGAYEEMKDFFFSCPWFKVYDFLERLAQNRSELLPEDTRAIINRELELHNAAYRFVGKRIVEITSQVEIGAIEDAQKVAPDPVRVHLQDALRMLSDRQKPDYRNSIKESISAVESVCRVATGQPKATLSDALKKIKNLHPALAQGFEKIYGYTSDADGIRHSLTTGQSTASYADAKFMLVACSAFVSYLQAAMANTK